MSYSKLSSARKKAIAQNAYEYAKKNYKQFNIALSPDVADKFDSVRAAENLSRPEMIKKLLEIYDKSTKSKNKCGSFTALFYACVRL